MWGQLTALGQQLAERAQELVDEVALDAGEQLVSGGVWSVGVPRVVGAGKPSARPAPSCSCTALPGPALPCSLRRASCCSTRR